MKVASIRVEVGARTIWMGFDTMYDAHTVAKIMSEGCPFEVELWQGSVRTHVYYEGTAIQEYVGSVQ